MAKEAERFFERVFTGPHVQTLSSGAKPNDRVRSAALELFEGKGIGADLPSSEGTAYGLLNAVTEFVDHQRRARSTDYRLDSDWFGQGANLKQKALRRGDSPGSLDKQHPGENVKWMRANLDYRVVRADDVQILECKTAGEFGAQLWRDGVPEYVQCQVQHQLAVTGKQAADVCVLICGQEIRIHRIHRDDALIELERRFWKYVETDTPPHADGSGSADQALRYLYPKDSGEVLDLIADEAMSGVFLFPYEASYRISRRLRVHSSNAFSSAWVVREKPFSRRVKSRGNVARTAPHSIPRRCYELNPNYSSSIH